MVLYLTGSKHDDLQKRKSIRFYKKAIDETTMDQAGAIAFAAMRGSIVRFCMYYKVQRTNRLWLLPAS